MTGTNLQIDADRLWADLMELAGITDKDAPWTRRAFSPLYLAGRDWLTRRMRAAGLEVRLDTAANLIGRRAGRRPELGAIAIGSHIDTVPNGGRFDGPAGVLAGLEVARSLEEQGVTLDHDLEIIDCLAEEVSIFGLSCIGSRAIAGALDAQALLRRSPDGRTLGAALREMGGRPEELTTARRRDLAAFLELHIEQGPLLERDRLDIGVVTTIVGIRRYEIVVSGRADHAGTTPMSGRSDALVAAAALVSAIDTKAKARSLAGPAHFVATVGEFRIEPNAANVIPSRAVLLIDARAEASADLDDFGEELARLIHRIAADHGVNIAPPRQVSDNRPMPCDPELMEKLEQACEQIGARDRRMASGAGHDTAWFARVCPAAMIFVPCRGGRSHTPEEWAEPAAIALGASVLLETVRRIDAVQGK